MAVISWGRAIAFGATLHKALMPQQKCESREIASEISADSYGKTSFVSMAKKRTLKSEKTSKQSWDLQHCLICALQGSRSGFKSGKVK
ncbi:hypothetical protein DYI23_01425 [Roseibium polysiphoniae]|uniref:Uncharacterized protein n=1 Tax=Roseibium polysiphoniae TaxID=2571221 RepID=A0A944GR47_9HYPH|nr:hypothetical protein [Roseibium polysiphoniae]MBS8258864.1 hypothetical protein [Roseibium polysiphoniae]